MSSTDINKNSTSLKVVASIAFIAISALIIYAAGRADSSLAETSAIYWVLTILSAILVIAEFVIDKDEDVGSGTEFIAFLGLPILFAVGKLIFSESDLGGVGFCLIMTYGFLLLGLFAIIKAKERGTENSKGETIAKQNKKGNKK